MFSALFQRERKPRLDTGYLLRVAADVRPRVRLRLIDQLAELLANPRASARERADVQPVLLKLAMDMDRDVRAHLADRLKPVENLDAEIIYALAGDEDAIALPFLKEARALRDATVQLAICKAGDAARRKAICARKDVSAEAARFVATRGEREALLTLLKNPHAPMWPALARRLYARFNADEEIVNLMLARADLPLEVRLAHVEVQAGRGARAMNTPDWRAARLAVNAVPDAREENIARVLGQAKSREELEIAFTFLTRRGRLTAAVLLQAACAGHVFVLGHALAWLTQTRLSRVEKLFRPGASLALARTMLPRAGLPETTHALALAIILAAQGQNAAVMQPNHKVEHMNRRILEVVASTDALSVTEKIQVCNLLMQFTGEDTRKLAAKLAESLIHHAA